MESSAIPKIPLQKRVACRTEVVPHESAVRKVRHTFIGERVHNIISTPRFIQELIGRKGRKLADKVLLTFLASHWYHATLDNPEYGPAPAWNDQHNRPGDQSSSAGSRPT